MSIEHMDQKLQSILEEFECPICLNYMLPPIRTCLKGHSFCNRCDKKLAKCPFCRSKKSGTRNYGMEKIVTKLTVPCKNTSTGCTTKLQGDQLRDHQKFCEYKTTMCPLRTICNCAWKGLIADIIGHCLENHPNNAYDSSKMHLLYPRFRNGQIARSTELGDSYHMIFRAHGELFKFVWDINTNNGYMRWCVIYLGPRANAEKYYFEVIFQNVENPSQENPVYIQAACQKVHPIHFHQTMYVLSHINKLRKLTGARGLYYTVSISKFAEEPENKLPEITTDRSVLSRRPFLIPDSSLFFDMYDSDDVRSLFEFQEEDDDEEGC